MRSNQLNYIQIIFIFNASIIGVITFKKSQQIELADTYTFRKDVKNVNFIKIGSCPSTCKLCLACLLNFAEQASWAELIVEGICLTQKTKKGTFIRVEKLSF